MKTKISLFLLFAMATVAFIIAFAPTAAHAQDAASAVSPAAISPPAPAAELPSALVDFMIQHSWVTTVLAAFGALSVVYQSLIAWAHKRAAATADPADDQWIASLESKSWFRILDRLFYWGGYLGSALGGKKL